MLDQTNSTLRPGWTVGIIAAVLAAAIRWQFLGVLELRATYITFYPAVIISALYGGFSAGLLATVVSAALADYFWVAPVGRFAIENFADLASLILFIVNGFFISYVAELAFRSRARALKAEERIRLAAEREKSALELEESEERLRISKQAASLGIHDYDVVSGNILWDERTRELWGVGPDATITYEVFMSGLHPDDRDSTQAAVDSALDPDGNGQYLAEFRVLAQNDATERWVRATGQVFFEATRPVRLVGTVQDITGQKLLEEALRLSEEKFSGTFHASVSGLSISRLEDGALIEVNDRWLDLFGFEREEVAGKVVFKDTWQNPAERAQMVRDLERDGFFAEREVQFRRQNGEEWAGLASSRVITLNVEPVIIASVVDISDRKRAENEVRRQKAILETINLIFQEALSRDTEEELGAICLQLIETLTRSKFGLIAGINPDGLLHGKGMANDEPGREVCTMYDRTVHRPPPRDKPHGLYGRVLLEGESLLTNEPHLHPESIGMPEGHPELTAFLGVPLIKDGKTIGVIGLGNREGGYGPEHQRAVETIAPAIVQVLDRKRAEQALRESRATIDAALASMTDAVFISDAKGRLIDFNDGFVKYHRFGSRGECSTHISECDFLDVWMENGRPAPLDMWAVPRALRGEAAINTQYALRRRDTGETWTGSYSFGPILDKDGEIIGAVVSARDITEQRRMEEEIRELSQRLSYHVDNSPLAVIEWGPDMRLIRWAGEAERMFGWRAEEVIGRRMEDFRWIYKDDEARVAAVSYELQSGANPQRFSANRNYRKDGSVIHCEWYNSSLLDASGKLRSILSLALDVTDRDQMEDDLRKSRDELESRVEERTAELKMLMAKLEESNQALEEFAFIAAHDLQEPLRKVKSFGNMLNQRCAGSLGEQGQDYLGRMLGANERMEALLKALLEYSRLSTRAEPFVAVELGGIIQGVLSDLEVRIERTGGKVLVGEFPLIKADPQQMRQLFQNLIGNGLKFHKAGENPVVEVRSGVVDNGKIRIEVSDNGIGFDEQYIEKIFAPFQRLHGRSSQYEGTGMGLSICRKIVERHGGSITAKSAPGKGAIFIVALPAGRVRLTDKK